MSGLRRTKRQAKPVYPKHDKSSTSDTSGVESYGYGDESDVDPYDDGNESDGDPRDDGDYHPSDEECPRIYRQMDPMEEVNSLFRNTTLLGGHTAHEGPTVNDSTAIPAEGVLLDKHAPPKYLGYERGTLDRQAVKDAGDLYEAEKIKSLGGWQTGIARSRVNITLEDLQKRTKGPRTRQMAQRKMEEFERRMELGEVKAYGVSHMICDRNGELLVACYGKRALPTLAKHSSVKRPASPNPSSHEESHKRAKGNSLYYTDSPVPSPVSTAPPSQLSSTCPSPTRFQLAPLPSVGSTTPMTVDILTLPAHVGARKRPNKEWKLLHKSKMDEITNIENIKFASEEDRQAYFKDKTVLFDGLEPHVLENVAWESQHFAHTVGIRKNKIDVRHTTDEALHHRFPRGMYCGVEYEKMVFSSKTRPQVTGSLGIRGRHRKIEQARDIGPPECQVDKEEKVYSDRVGVIHLDRCWEEQAHGTLGRSSDLMGACCYRSTAAMRYMGNTNRYLQAILTPYLYSCAPNEYSDMRKSFLASSLDAGEEETHGFQTGQVIVYNEVVHQHIDGEDSGLCITFCTGSFQGGWMYFPDLEVAFWYTPGTVMIFRSAALYHGVTTWKADGGISKSGIFPGRRSYVFYTKKGPFDQLKSNEAGWIRSTAGGTAPSEYAPGDTSVGHEPINKSHARTGYQGLRSRLYGWRISGKYDHELAAHIVD